MNAVVTTPADWYLLLGSGLVTLILCSLTVCLGVIGVRRWGSPLWPRVLTARLHRSIALLTVCFLVVHITTAVLDQWVGLGWADVLVPFCSPYRPVAVGFGTLALDLLVAVTLTSLFRRRLGHRLWRAVHWSAWLLWPLAVAHGLSAGTDTGSDWGLAVCLGCISLVLAAAIWRMVGSRPRRHPVTGPSSDIPGDRKLVGSGATVVQ